MRTVSAWLLAVVLSCLGPAAASAGVLYKFNGYVTGAADGSFPNYTGPTSFDLIVTDEAVQSGSISFAITAGPTGCGTPTTYVCVFSGEPEKLIQLSDLHGIYVTPTAATGGTYSLGITFDSIGLVTGGSFNFFGVYEDYSRVTSSGAIFSGAYFADSPNCTSCTVVGSFSGPTFVPEPSTLAVLLAAIAVLFAALNTGLIARRR